MQQHNIRQGTEAAPEVSYASGERRELSQPKLKTLRLRKSDEIIIQMLLLSGVNISSQQSLKLRNLYFSV